MACSLISCRFRNIVTKLSKSPDCVRLEPKLRLSGARIVELWWRAKFRRVSRGLTMMGDLFWHGRPGPPGDRRSRHRTRLQGDGRRFRIPDEDGGAREQLQPPRPGLQLLGRGPVPVCGSDLAADAEAA